MKVKEEFWKALERKDLKRKEKRKFKNLLINMCTLRWHNEKGERSYSSRVNSLRVLANTNDLKNVNIAFRGIIDVIQNMTDDIKDEIKIGSGELENYRNLAKEMLDGVLGGGKKTTSELSVEIKKTNPSKRELFEILIAVAVLMEQKIKSQE